MKYAVTGGVYTDTTFEKLKEGTEEVYGPFDTYEEASIVWKAQMWLKVDNALHRLRIIEVDE